MMAGRKHLAGFDSIPEASNDSVFQNKRIFAGSSFDVHRAQSSQQQSIGAPPLDTHRAELSRQHVRALNTQFASWVHSQLQNHPDELWEDGVQDYLDHASNVKEKFSDIVNWLKANALKGERVFGLGSQDAPKKPLFENKDNQIKLDKEQTSLGMVSATPSFAPPSWSSGAFATQTSFSFGNQIVASSNNDASNDVDDAEEELQQPSSPSVKKTKEEGIIVVHEVKCKLYVKSSDPVDKDAWKDKGMGQLSIKCKEGVSKGTRESKPIILVRNDVGRIVLNASLYPGIKTNMQKNSIVAIFHTTGESGNDGGENNGVVAQTFLIRTRTEDDRDKLASAIQEYAPAPTA